MNKTRPHIVIIGGNFAGLTAAVKLPASLDVTVIDPTEHFEWIPNIHEILSSVKTPRALRLDRAEIVKRAGHRFLRDRVTVLQPAKHSLVTAGGKELRFDACIVAVGGLSSAFHVPGVVKYALPFRSIADSQQIERRLSELAARKKPVRVVIVGGGISGIETLGEILRRYRDHPELAVDLIEAAPQLLAGLPPELDADLRSVCKSLPVSFHTGTAIDSVTAKGVRLADGRRLHSDLTIWAAGMTPPALLHESGLAREPAAWAAVTQTLQSRFYKRVFVAGDAAVLPKPIGKQAYNAIDMGEIAAVNVKRLLDGRELKPFKPSAKPLLIAFGDLQTYMVAGKAVLASKVFAGAKEGVYQVFMSQMSPGNVLTTLPAAAGRLWQGWRELALPQLHSLADFKSLPDLRAVRKL